MQNNYTLEQLLEKNKHLKSENARLKNDNIKIIKKCRQEQSLKPYQAELLEMQNYLDRTGKKMLVLFEGRGAAGKGGTIRRLTRYMNAKHYRVVALGKPTEEQKNQWFFQRYVHHLPAGGEIVFFDRSWYNRAMVEPVLNFCTDSAYNNFMKGVSGFEQDLIRQGLILVKLYFSVTKEEQQRRFDKDQIDPLRKWKLSELDVQSQERWDDFSNVKYEMLRKTHNAIAPWHIIRSDNKYQARLNTMKLILNSVPYQRVDINLDFIPDNNIVYSGAHEIEIMEAQRIRQGKFIN